MKNRAIIIFCIVLFNSGTGMAQTDSSYNQGFDYGDWGVGAELGPCSGMFFLNGNADQFINDGWCNANVGVTISHKKLHYKLQTGGLDCSLKKDLPYDPEWKKDNSLGSVNLHLSIGYQILNTRLFNIIPFVSGGMTAFNTKDANEGSKGITTDWNPSYSIGSSFDFKINFAVKEKNRFPGSDYNTQYLYFRILTGIYPNYFQNPIEIEGSMYYVNISIGAYFKGSKKKE